jgi:predicted Ser/Thr protein kinase
VVPGTIISSRFVVEREVGAGGMGTVYRALDRLDGARVALKMLRGEDEIHLERFAQEAAILAQLHHPGVVRYVAHGATSTGERYLAMEWIEGETLTRRLAAGPISIPEALTLMRRTAEALASAHAHGMVHRDLKPDNLLLVGNDVARVKIVDFGIAWPSRETRRLTRTGTIIGTSGYVAPEQIGGERLIDARIDVFALGCVFFECLVQRPAFAGSNPMAVLAKILFDEAPRARQLRPDVPEALDQLIARMLSKDPLDRPADAADVAFELARLASPIEARGSATMPIALSVAPESGSFPASSTTERLRASLTMSEQRLVSLVLAGRVDAPLADDPGLPVAEIQAVVELHEGHLELLSGRALVITFWIARDARDHAARAAACALALAARFPELPIAVVTGRELVAARRVGGEVSTAGRRSSPRRARARCRSTRRPSRCSPGASGSRARRARGSSSPSSTATSAGSLRRCSAAPSPASAAAASSRCSRPCSRGARPNRRRAWSSSPGPPAWGNRCFATSSCSASGVAASRSRSSSGARARSGRARSSG